MCDKHPFIAPQEAQTSRRRRIWELAHTCHCPLVGVSLPLATLRKLVGKVTGGTILADDYEIHVGAVSECGTRNRLSEALQKELERRYAAVVQRFRAARTTEGVAELWQAAVAGGDVAGAFWAGLTHPRCAQELEEKMCRDLHMIQHQAGACARADIHRFNAVVEENGQLTRELSRVQKRNAAMQLEHTAEQDRHAAALMQLRAQLVGRDSVIDSLRQELEGLRASIPGLPARERLAQRLEQMEEREQMLRDQVIDLRRALTQSVAQSMAQNAALADAAAAHEDSTPAAPAPIEHVMRMPVSLTERSILCVGGRNGNVASYRAVIERAGGQFAHHDGGLEDNAGRLEASLAAADMVICQTGCISHSAYWRVKDFCKRTGKRCVFIENPSVSSLQRGLEELAPDALT
ncbi:uncharacterized protein DUF2325 [Pseudoduganella lurida]|uniref:Uncharacterized protein DUF2325 n=1 Tax=Pseudoduganella lurida TaxID=1036180 RepID=A0A562R0V2_9BURK|nr:DUF2325 domain-containing protein [Pseudoduganella lurida]TWI62204.1 uncharacterized protein DUF2325 [Pseudoduganella lurida]